MTGKEGRLAKKEREREGERAFVVDLCPSGIPLDK